MTKLLVVKGGTPNGSSNRMQELSFQLECVCHNDSNDQWSKSFADFFLQASQGNVTMDEMVEFFEIMVEKNYHLVGSRDYVYRSDQMLKLVKMARDGELPSNCPMNYLPRTVGFRYSMVAMRDKHYEFLNKENV